MKNRKIKWDKQAVLYLNTAIAYIEKNSPQNANRVRTEILVRINNLSQHPEVYAPDKFKKDNTGSYRAFEIYHFRISYLVRDEEIIIARVRHTGQEPQAY